MVINSRYPAETIIDTGYADDLALHAITQAQAESLLQSLGETRISISLYVNANKSKEPSPI